VGKNYAKKKCLNSKKNYILPAESRLSGGSVSIAMEQVVGHNAQILLSNCSTIDWIL
jgi:hypothetical protein